MGNIFFTSYCSILESDALDEDLSFSIQDSTYLINPKYSICIGKAIVIDLPVEINLSKLSKYSDIYSRFPIDGIDNIIPFTPPTKIKEVKPSEYSLSILNKYLMDSEELEDIEKLKSENFLLGIQSEVDDYLTAVGYELLRTNINQFKDSKESN